MTETRDDALTDNPSNPSDTRLFVGIAEAARIAGVAPRTIRRWIDRGYLPAESSPDGLVVSPADLTAAQEAASQARRRGRPRSQPAPNGVDEEQGAAPPYEANGRSELPVPISPAEQLEALRGEWLAPVVEQLQNLEQEHQGLTERISALESQRKVLLSEAERGRQRMAELEAQQEEFEQLVREMVELDDGSERVAGRSTSMRVFWRRADPGEARQLRWQMPAGPDDEGNPVQQFREAAIVLRRQAGLLGALKAGIELEETRRARAYEAGDAGAVEGADERIAELQARLADAEREYETARLAYTDALSAYYRAQFMRRMRGSNPLTFWQQLVVLCAVIIALAMVVFGVYVWFTW